jgi:hypothetical protein
MRTERLVAPPFIFDTDLGIPLHTGRTKTFPPHLAQAPLPAATDPNETVLLEIRNRSHLHGTVGSVRIEADLRHFYEGGLTGSLDGEDFRVSIHESSAGPDRFDVAVAGTVGEQNIRLRGELHPPPGTLFGGAQITGSVGENVVALRVEGANGGLGTSDTVAAEGTFGTSRVELFASSDHDRGVIAGTVDNADVRVAARWNDRYDSLVFSGCYRGPLPLLIIAIITMQGFI